MRGERAGFGIEGANVARDDAAPLAPVDTRVLALDLGRVRGGGVVLRALTGLPELEERERFDQRERPELGQAELELAVGLILEHRHPCLENDRSRVERRHHAHDRDARLDQPLTDGGLDRGRATELGEERRVHVDRA